VLEVMSEAVNVIAEGEVLQLMNVNDPDITEENYMRVIYSKTRLFEAAAQCSGILAGLCRSTGKRCRIMAAIWAPPSS
jgi:octaprenyl-diphosphate synthase